MREREHSCRYETIGKSEEQEKKSREGSKTLKAVATPAPVPLSPYPQPLITCRCGRFVFTQLLSHSHAGFPLRCWDH